MKAEILINALEKIIEMNRQTAMDKYGDPNRAETWGCVTVAREAIKKYKEQQLQGRKKFPRLNLRFKFSQKWIRSSQSVHRSNEKRGTVLFESKDGKAYLVQFDGNKSASYYAKEFIEIIEQES